MTIDKAFYQHILDKQQITGAVPSNKEIAEWALQVIRLLYPEQSSRLFTYVHQLESEFKKLEHMLYDILNATRGTLDEKNEQLSITFFNGLPELYPRTLLCRQAFTNPGQHRQRWIRAVRRQ